MISISFVDSLIDLMKNYHITEGDMWCVALNPNENMPTSGWKLHISATPHNASEILRIAGSYFIQNQISFKFLKSTVEFDRQNNWSANRGSSGKFITVYPNDDLAAVKIAKELSDQLKGFEGPRILSDRRYGPDGIVYYRYGGFKPQLYFNHQGVESHLIRSGEYEEEDLRVPWFRVPSWVDFDPFIGAPLKAPPLKQTRALPIIKQRYQILAAMKHGNKGGVYKALDLVSNQEIVLKEARPKVGEYTLAQDAAHNLQLEYRLLDEFKDLELFPVPIEIFEFGTHTFLAENLIEGVSFRKLIADVGMLRGRKLAAFALAFAKKLQACHEAGIVLRDLSPSNLMYAADGELKIIDLGCACHRDGDLDRYHIGWTPGYSDTSGDKRYQNQPCYDLFSFGAIIFFAATGRNPVWTDATFYEIDHQTLIDYVDHMKNHGALSETIHQIILRSMVEDPEQRQALTETIAQLTDDLSRRVSTQVPRRATDGPMISSRIEQIFLDSVHGLARSQLDAASSRSKMSRPTDPFALYTGAGGIASVLLNALRHPEVDAALLEQSIRAINYRIANELSGARRDCNGLFFGKSGIALHLLRSGVALEDEPMKHAAKQLLAECTSSVTHDLTHGLAGIGLAQLEFFHVTGTRDYLNQAAAVAKVLATTALKDDDGYVFWHEPEKKKDDKFLGFAHGTAGVAFFLSSVLQRMPLPDAETLLETLYQNLRASSRDGIEIPMSPGSSLHLTSWCHGYTGYGIFLANYSRFQQDQRMSTRAMNCLRAFHTNRWREGVSFCHGLSSGLELAADLAQHEDAPLEEINLIAQDLFDVALLQLSETPSQQRLTGIPSESFKEDHNWSFGVGSSGLVYQIGRHLFGWQSICPH